MAGLQKVCCLQPFQVPWCHYLLRRPRLNSLAHRGRYMTVSQQPNLLYGLRIHTDSEPQLRLMPLGGSVTYGVGSSDGTGYRKILLDMLLSDGYQVRMVGSRKSGSMRNNENDGWRGYRLDQIETKVRASLATSRPNIFTINAGSNDCIQNFQLRDFGKRMDNLLSYLWQACPLSTVILSTLLVNADSFVNQRVLLVNDQIRGVVQSREDEAKRIVLADMYNEGPQANDLIDGTHPGDSGYQKMAKAWHASIRRASSQGFL